MDRKVAIHADAQMQPKEAGRQRGTAGNAENDEVEAQQGGGGLDREDSVHPDVRSKQEQEDGAPSDTKISEGE